MQAFSQKSYYVTQKSQMRVYIDERTRSFDERTKRRIYLTREREDENNAAAAEACKTIV